MDLSTRTDLNSTSPFQKSSVALVKARTRSSSSQWDTLVGIKKRGQSVSQTLTMLTLLACLLAAIQAVSKKLGKEDIAKNAVVDVSVNIGTSNEQPGFGLSVDIAVKGIDEELLQAAHAVSYANYLLYASINNHPSSAPIVAL